MSLCLHRRAGRQPRRSRLRGGALATLLTLASTGCGLPGDPPFDPLDAQAPTLIETVPTRAAVRVPPDAVILLAFSEPLAAGQPSLAQLHLASGDLVASFEIERPRPGLVRLLPKQPLQAGARYRLLLDPSISDPTMNPLAGERALTFTISSAEDPLTVLETSPPRGGTGLGPRPTLRLSFDVPISTLTLDPAFVRLEDSSGEAQRLRASLDDADPHVVEVVPAIDLSPSTLYTLTISTELRDVQSRHLALPFVLSFTTG